MGVNQLNTAALLINSRTDISQFMFSDREMRIHLNFLDYVFN
jgi:hypothetical protein